MQQSQSKRNKILATLCYLRDEEKTLMLFRNRKKNDIHKQKWNGLGGKLEAGETPEECAIREVLEESGLEVSDPYLRGFLTFPLFDGINDWYVFLFTFKHWSGSMIDSPEGELSWIPNDLLLELNLWEGDRIFLQWLDDPGFFSAKFTYEHGKLVEWSVENYGVTKT